MEPLRRLKSYRATKCFIGCLVEACRRRPDRKTRRYDPSSKSVTAQITVRKIEADNNVRLKRRAVRHGTSMEAEVRQILRNAINDDEHRTGPGLGSRIAARFKHTGSVDPLPELRGQAPKMPDWPK